MLIESRQTHPRELHGRNTYYSSSTIYMLPWLSFLDSQATTSMDTAIHQVSISSQFLRIKN